MPRAKNQIRLVSELPDWFNLDKYQKASILDATGWYEQLDVRKTCFLILRLSNYSLEALSVIRDNPIVDITSNGILFANFWGGALTELKQESLKPVYSLGIHPMTARELLHIYNELAPGKREYLRRWREQFEPIRWGEKFIYKCKKWIDEPLIRSINKSNFKRFNKKPALIVNLDVLDAILIESFKQWLSSTRQEIQTEYKPKQYRQPDFNEWIRLGVLPYLDLVIWSKETGVKIPNRVMADAIYATGEGGEETVRKTTAPLAEKLVGEALSEGSPPLEALMAQAAHERIDRYSQKAEESEH